MKDLLFIDILDETGRVSTLGVYGRKKDFGAKKFTITVIGGLPHCTEFAPKSISDANKLIRWLQEWKDKQEE